MTVVEVIERVGKIKKIRGDDEVAHSNEDELHQDVLEAIAEGTAEDAMVMAAEALKTRDIGFARWCA